MRPKTNKIDEALMECYCLLYENSEPKADFKELMDNAVLNKLNQKVIDFDSYLIDETKMVEIIESVIKKYKIRGYKKQQFKNTIHLGCSPKTKRIKNEATI